MAFTNADGILNKLPELQNYLKSRKPDVFAIVESNCTDSIPDSLLCAPGYKILRLDNSNERRGGILAFVRDDLEVKQCHELARHCSLFKESSWSWVYMSKTTRLLLGILYRKPSSCRVNDEKMIKLLEKAATLTNNLVVCGDFNLPDISWTDSTAKNKHNEGYNTPVEMLNVTQTHGLHQHVRQFTRARGTNQPSLLDLLITSQADNVDNLEVLPPLGKSDHGIIQAELLLPDVTSRKGDVPYKIMWNYMKGDYEKARKIALRIEWIKLFEGKTSDEQYNILVDQLRLIREECVPLKKISRGRDSNKKWFNDKAKRLVARKKHAWDAYMRAERLKLPEVNDYRKRYVRARNRAQYGIRGIKRRHEETLLTRLKSNPKLFYSYYNSKTKVREPVGQIRKPDGTLTSSNKEAAAALSQHFKNVFTVEDDANLIYANEYFSSLPLDGDDRICPFRNCEHRDVPVLDSIDISAQDIYRLLKELKQYKSPGPDELHPRLLSELSNCIAFPLKVIFDRSLSTGQVPKLWKLANVTAVHKKGSRDEAQNYRPISLTCICSKLMERIVNEQVMKHLIHNDILSSQQHGFTPGRSCLTNLLTTLEDCSRNLDDKVPTDIIYLDFAKAFDTVPHARLCHKLQRSGIGGPLLKWLEDFLYERKQRVILNGAHSAWERVISGVPQGSVIGPTLFLLFINDLPDRIASKVQIFADDSKIYRHIHSPVDVHQLQEDLQEVERWSLEWKLRYNTSKCQTLRIGTKNMQSDRPTYKLNGVNLENIQEQRDLGVTIDSSLEFETHINKSSQRAYAAWGIARRTFEKMSPALFRLVYKTFIRPHVEFCPQVWSPYKKFRIKKIEKVQRITTKGVIGMRGLEYPERLKELQLTTLEERRERGDLLETHKILHKLHTTDLSHLFQVRNRTDRDFLKLYKSHNRTLKRGKHFSQRVISKWNMLDNDTKRSTSSNQFKSRYDKFKRRCK